MRISLSSFMQPLGNRNRTATLTGRMWHCRRRQIVYLIAQYHIAPKLYYKLTHSSVANRLIHITIFLSLCLFLPGENSRQRCKRPATPI